MNVYIVISIFIVHWISDFLLQERRVAMNKHNSLIVLTEHVTIYTIGWVMAGFAYSFVVSIQGIHFNMYLLLFIPITFVCHFITDFFTSKANHYFHKKNQVKNFWGMVGFDQAMHHIQLIVTYCYLDQLT